MSGKGAEYFLRGNRSASLPFVERGPCGLDSFDNALFEVSRVLLDDDDGLVEEVLFENLALKW